MKIASCQVIIFCISVVQIIQIVTACGRSGSKDGYGKEDSNYTGIFNLSDLNATGVYNSTESVLIGMKTEDSEVGEVRNAPANVPKQAPRITMKYRYCLCKRRLDLSEMRYEGEAMLNYDDIDEEYDSENQELTFADFELISDIRKRRRRSQRSSRSKRFIWYGPSHTYVEFRDVVFDFSSDNDIGENREDRCCDYQPLEDGYSACSLQNIRQFNRRWETHPSTKRYRLITSSDIPTNDGTFD
uniref:Uncharacterized protein LOC100371664 n=1 Tax=Saccoglossus kowalevskii TaxID=10224 RepID=A0ABM0GLF6_SACKO|nr:PREDICTED: uncharacterized protein LOC100371664 [Saccoglossus kowalevskii]